MARQEKDRKPRVEKVVDLLRERVEQSGCSCRAIEIKAGWPLKFEDNSAGRMLQILTKHNPRIVSLLQSVGCRLSGDSHG